MIGADHVFVYNRNGQIIDELVDAQVSRTWHLDNVGRGIFSIPTSSGKFRYELVQANNIVLVVSEELGTWAGVMWGRYRETNGLAQVDLYDMRFKLNQRRTAAVEVQTGNSGTIYTNLINIANSQENTLITPDSVYISTSGTSISRTYNAAKIYEVINKLSTDVNVDWWIHGERSGSSSISLLARWGTRGRTVSEYELIENRDLFNIDLTQEGEIINDVLAYGLTDSSDWSTVITATSVDADSIALYGRCQGVIAALDTEDATTLGMLASSLVSRQKYPRFTIYADIGGAYYPDVGDVVNVILQSTGFVDRARGGRKTMRVISKSFDPKGGGTVSIAMKEV